MNKGFFFIILFFFLKNPSSAETINKCSDEINFTKINKVKNLEKIDIEISNRKKWLKNIFYIIRNSGWIKDEFKKNHRANVYVSFNNGLKCKLLGKIKFHGDNPDHYKLIDDFNIISSLNVKLNNSNIENITEFKLFLPSTRRGDNELLTVNFLRNIKFFAPKTKKIKATINGFGQKYLFQEKISKELIESYGFFEGPIIEGDQRLLHEGIRGLHLGRIVNKNWVKKNWRNAYISISALSRINEIYLKFYKSRKNFSLSQGYPFTDSLSLLNDLSIKFNRNLDHNYYEHFLLLMGGKHGLVPDNRTFYFNYIENNFYPIYYDGHTGFEYDKIGFRHDEFDSKKYKYTKIQQQKFNNHFVTKTINKIDLKKLHLDNINSGVNSLKFLNFKERIKYFKEISKIIIMNNNDSEINNIKSQKFNNFYKSFKKENIKLIFFLSKPNNFIVCEYDNSKCSEKKFSLEDVGEILSQRYKKNSEKIYIFVSNDYNKYEGNDKTTKENKWENINITENFIAKVTKDKISLDFDQKKKEIKIVQKHQNGRVIFLTKNLLDNWKINFNSIVEKNLNQKIINKEDLDGCITFYENSFENINIEMNNAFCEDSVNFIRSEGIIEKVIINNSLSDGLDMDFSNIKINKIIVNNSGNDCVDMSFGNYEIKNLELEKCIDNGISVGENSILKSMNINTSNSNNALAVKDSSKVIVDNLISKNNNYCFRIYNKKQEFFGGELFLKNLNCDSKYFVEKMSKFILNEL